MAQDRNTKCKWITIQGSICIVWLFNTNDEEISKSAKDEVGLQNMEVPMLDTRRDQDSMVYCDIILYTDHVTGWEAAIRNQFISYHQITRKVTGGQQISFSSSNTGTPFCTVNFYPGTKKIMIQPGQRLESNLLKWLSYYPAMKVIATGQQAFCRAQETSESTGESASTAVKSPFLNPQLNSGSETVTTTSARVRSESDPELVPGNKSLNCENSSTSAFATPPSTRAAYSSPAMQTVTSPRSPVGIIRTSTVDSVQVSTPQSTTLETNPKSTHAANTVNNISASSGVYVDELLCFIQNKINTDSMDNVVKLCSDFYSEEDTELSKSNLFDIVHPPDRYIKRRGQNKTKDNLMDMCTIFYSLDIATFVAHTLSKLPPITSHEFGVGKILREIEALKVVMKNIGETYTSSSSNELEAKTRRTPQQGSVAAPAVTHSIQESGPEPSHQCATDSTAVQIFEAATIVTKDTAIQASTNGMQDPVERDITDAPATISIASSNVSERYVSVDNNDEEFITIDCTVCRSNSNADNTSNSLYSETSSKELSFIGSELVSTPNGRQDQNQYPVMSTHKSTHGP